MVFLQFVAVSLHVILHFCHFSDLCYDVYSWYYFFIMLWGVGDCDRKSFKLLNIGLILALWTRVWGDASYCPADVVDYVKLFIPLFLLLSK